MAVDTLARTLAAGMGQNVTDVKIAMQEMEAEFETMKAMVGTPLVAATASAMTDHNKIYVYVKSPAESGYTTGHWYYWNGSAWADGGVYNSQGLETDKTLSIPDMAADAETTGDAINEIKEAIDEKDAALLVNENHGWYINNGVWAHQQSEIIRFLLISINPGDKIKIVGNTSTTVAYSVFNTFSTPTVGASPDYATGYTGGVEIVKNKYAYFEVPSNGHYLYIYCGNTIAYDRVPTAIYVNGYNYYSGIRDNIIDTTEQVLLSQKRNGYINLSTNQWSAQSSEILTHLCIPVSSGDEIYINGRAGNTAGIALLTSYSVANGVTPNYSSDSAWVGGVMELAGLDYQFIVPNDAKYLYVLASDANGRDRLPQSIQINGKAYNIAVSEQENIEEVSSYINQNIKPILQTKRYKGYIKTDTLHWNYTSSNYYTIYPVSSGDRVTVIAPNSATAGIAFLKSYSTSVANANGAVDLSTQTGFTEPITVASATGYTATVPSDAKYLYVYNGTSSLDRFPAAVYINGYNILLNLTDNVLRSAPIPIRIMQYNIGKYTWGKADWHLTTQATSTRLSYSDYMENYRKLFSEYEPDFIGLEEYLPTLNVEVSGSSPTTYEEHNIKEEIFDVPYPIDLYYTNNERCIKAKSSPIGYRGGAMTETYNSTTYTCKYVISHFDYNGKILCVFTCALPYYPTDAGVYIRNVFLNRIYAMLATEEYALIVLDMNNGGNYESTGSTQITSEQEGQQLLVTARSAGWNFANGGYLGFQRSYIPNPGVAEHDLRIDNIIYKNNGKVVFKGFTVLTDEYENLSSDHVPTFGDFLLI